MGGMRDNNRLPLISGDPENLIHTDLVAAQPRQTRQRQKKTPNKFAGKYGKSLCDCGCSFRKTNPKRRYYPGHSQFISFRYHRDA